MSYTEIRIVNNDRGCYATKRIAKDTIIFEWESPMIGASNVGGINLEVPNIKFGWAPEAKPKLVINEDSLEEEPGPCCNCYMTKQIVRDSEHRRKVMQLKGSNIRSDNVKCSEMNTKELRDIHARIEINKFDLSDLITGEGAMHASALYHKASMLNHRCVSYNTSPIFSRGRINFVAVRDIEIGEELNFTYIGMAPAIFGSINMRKKLVEDKFGFKCRCPECVEDTQFWIPLSEDSKLMLVTMSNIRKISTNETVCRKIIDSFDSVISSDNNIFVQIAFYVVALACCNTLFNSKKPGQDFENLELSRMKLKEELDTMLSKYLRCTEDIVWFVKWQGEFCPDFGYAYHNIRS